MDSKASKEEREEWKEIVERILEKDMCTAVILGYIDTGKTSFLHYASKKIRASGKNVSIIDCDVGQSSIGPPGCLGLQNNSGEEYYYFIGDVYPYDHTKMVAGLLELTSRADSPYVLIDTTGLVFWNGRSLKRAKITSLSPDMIVAFQRGKELEGILRDYPTYDIVRKPVNNKTYTSREQRRTIRKNLWKKYLQDAQVTIYTVEDITLRNTFLFSGEACDPEKVKDDVGTEIHWCEKIPEGFFVVAERYGKQKNMTILKKGFERGLIAGFIKDEICIGIGRVISIDFERKEIYLFTNVKEEFDFLEFGRLKITDDGEEVGRVYNLVY